MKRETSYDIMPEIQNRWSPRAISSTPVDIHDICSAMEAARQAPSCFNEQPWRFVLATEESELKLMRSFLTEKNQRWANKAPVLILIIAHKKFIYNGQPNRWNQFDTGTAWGYFSLELQRRGLVSHGMAGFDPERARKELGLSDDYDLIAMVAVGKLGNKDELPLEFQAMEQPGLRRVLEETVLTVKSLQKA
jgi:nitroreductase